MNGLFKWWLSRKTRDFYAFGCSIIWVIFADSRMEPGAKISIKSFFMEITFLLSAFSSSFLKSQAKLLLFGVNCRLQFAGLGRKERKVWSRPALCRERVKSFAVFFTCWDLKLDRWVKISARRGKWLEHWVIFARWGESKACNHIVLWILISLFQWDHIIILISIYHTSE